MYIVHLCVYMCVYVYFRMKTTKQKAQLSTVSSKKLSAGIQPPVKFRSKDIKVTLSRHLIQKACSRCHVGRKTKMVTQGTQTESPPTTLTTEERFKRYGLVRRQLAVLLHASLCRIRDGINAHSEPVKIYKYTCMHVYICNINIYVSVLFDCYSVLHNSAAS